MPKLQRGLFENSELVNRIVQKNMQGLGYPQLDRIITEV